ncbi:MAG: sensor histidine kinase [Sandaracinaceae bacterium]
MQQIPWIAAIEVASGPFSVDARRVRRPYADAHVEVRWTGDDPSFRAVVELAFDEAERHVQCARLERELSAMGERLDAVQARLVDTNRSAALGTMAASVAHDIRSPLAVLVSNLGFLEQVLADDPCPDVAATLTDNRLALELIEGVLDSMRTFVADQAGSGMVRVRPVVESAARLTRLYFARACVSLELDVVGDPVGRGTEGELCQILVNLLSNAAEATPAGGRVRLSVRRARDRAWIWVTDEGPGVAVDAREQIFELFHTSKANGLGLGLAIARQMARRHGGELRVCEAPTQIEGDLVPGGACFELSLPARLG